MKSLLKNSPSSARLLVEEFVNSSQDADEIVRFTQTYGPLDNEAREGGEFHFFLRRWKNLQSIFRQLWEGRAGRPVSRTFSGSSYDISIHNRRLVFLAKTLEGYLLMELAKAEATRLRKCVRPDCSNPYFVARHLKQQYCSRECAEWAQVQWKKKWWEEKGTTWLKSQKRQNVRKTSTAKRVRTSGRSLAE